MRTTFAFLRHRFWLDQPPKTHHIDKWALSDTLTTCSLAKYSFPHLSEKSIPILRCVHMNCRSGLNVLVVASLLMSTGCAWQRIPQSPVHQESNSLPVGIGIELADDPASAIYGPIIIKHLKEWHLFKSVRFPYRQGDPVDAVLVMRIQGGWTADSSNLAKGFLIGLSLYTLSPVIGVGMTGHHEVSAILQKETAELARYGIQQETHVEWGLAANAGEVSSRSDDLQTRTLAFKLAEVIRKDWPKLSRDLKPTPPLQLSEDGFTADKDTRRRVEQVAISAERQVRSFLLRYHAYLTSDISAGEGKYLSSLYAMLQLPAGNKTLRKLRILSARNKDTNSFVEAILSEYPVDDPPVPSKGGISSSRR
jgi:hypothetical protein